MDTKSLALVFAIVALAISIAGHSPIAFVVAIIALVLSQSDKHEEVAVILGIIALVIGIVLGGGILIH